MRVDKLTVKAQEALATAQELATQSSHSEITSLHLLSALLKDKDGIIRPILAKIGVDAGRVASVAESEMKRMPSVSGGTLAVARDLNDVMIAAQKEADNLKDEYVSTEHLLLALADVAGLAKRCSRC